LSTAQNQMIETIDSEQLPRSHDVTSN
jgi:hypothetical protein